MKYVNIPLGEVVDIVGGGTPDKSIPGYWGGVIPWATVKDLKGTAINSTQDHITAEGLQNSAARIIPAGNIIMATRMAVGRAAISSVDMAINQDLKAILTDRRLNTSYLFHFINSKTSYFEKKGKGATVKGIIINDIKELRIPLPPPSEQRRIADILDKAEALRAKRREALAELDGLAQAIFVDMFGDPSTNELNRYTDKLGEYLLFVTSGGRGWAQYYAQQGVRFIRSLDVRMNYIGEDDIAFVVPPDNAEARRTRVQARDVLLTITGSRIGRVAPVPDDLEGSFISQHVAILRPDQTRLMSCYLSYFLSFENGGQRLIAKAQYGQTKPGLNFEQIRSFYVPVPPIKMQKDFVRRVAAIEKLNTSHRASLAELDALFASLQHRAFRGEL